jgi:hypothetical protein
MPKTHHAARTFRLSCGCLRDYPGMAVGKRHEVLCPACSIAAYTLYAYPEKRCGATKAADVADGIRRVSCTNEPGTKQCGQGVHYDEFEHIKFSLPPKLRRGAEGNIGRQ